MTTKIKEEKPYEYYRKFLLEFEHEQDDFRMDDPKWERYQDIFYQLAEEFESKVSFPYVDVFSSMEGDLDAAGSSDIVFGEEKVALTGEYTPEGKYTLENGESIDKKEVTRRNPNLCFSNLAKMVTVYGLHSDLFTDELLGIIEELIDKYGYTYVPNKYLKYLYDGKNPHWVKHNEDKNKENKLAWWMLFYGV